jgi:hypothetical protein
VRVDDHIDAIVAQEISEEQDVSEQLSGVERTIEPILSHCSLDDINHKYILKLINNSNSGKTYSDLKRAQY